MIMSVNARPDLRSPLPAIVTLDIGEYLSRVVMHGAGRASATVEIAVGSGSTSARFFKSGLPAPDEFEAAIDGVEAEVMKLHPILDAGSVLVAKGAALGEFGRVSGCAPLGEGSASLEAVEQIFQRLVSASYGLPSMRSGLPHGTAFAATALILREFMHHLGFSSIAFAAD